MNTQMEQRDPQTYRVTSRNRDTCPVALQHREPLMLAALPQHELEHPFAPPLSFFEPLAVFLPLLLCFL